MADDALIEPVNKKLMFDDLSSPVKRRSFIANPKQPIRLYCRVRPQLVEELSRQETPCLHVADAQTLVSVAPEESFAYKSTKRGLAHRSHQFNFTKVFGPKSTQQEVYDDAVTHILKDFLEGQNSLLFSYGVTNSGKTHTICGTEEDPGILPRVLDSVFVSVGDQLYCGDELKPKNFSEVERLDKAGRRRELEAVESLLAKAHSMNSSMSSNSTWSSVRSIHSDLTVSSAGSSHSAVMEGTVLSECSQPQYEASTIYEPSVLDVNFQGKAVGVWVSCAEIYNEFIFDLFAEIPVKRVTRQKDKSGHPQRQALRLAADKNHNVFIKGLTEVQVTSVEDAMLLAQYGQHNRHVGTTLLNQSSSRSHCVFTIKLIRVTDTRRPKQATINRMSIVDLAGSERSRKTKGCGQVVKEAGSINVSLHILGKCITALRQNQKRDKTCIPFRESKLTQIFQNYFVGKGCGTREGRVTMFVNVSPSPTVFDESLKVLEVSAIASKVVPYVKPLPRGVGHVSEAVSIENAESTPVHEVILRQHSDEALAGQASDKEDVPSPEHTEVVLDNQATPFVVLPEGLAGGVMAFVTPGPPGTLQPACPTCEHYQTLVKKWKDELVELKLQLWEQESRIRSEVCKEFQEQIADIKESHKESLMDQADHLESMHEQRIGLLTMSIRKVVQSKKRRREEEGGEDSEVEDLQSQVKRLEETLASRDKELEDAKTTMKHLQRKYESSMVEQNSSTNDLAVKAMSLEKKIACLEDENAVLMKERDRTGIVMRRLETQNAELLEQLKVAEDRQKETACFMQESTLVMADQLRGCQAQLAQARQEAAEQKELKDELKQVQMNLDKLTAEKGSLVDEVASLTHSLEEHRALATKREAEWAESTEVVRGALEGQLVGVKKQLAVVEGELSDTRQVAKESQQTAKEKDEELTELFKKGISSEQFAVMEQKLEKSWATEKALRAEVKMWKTDLNKLKVSSEKELLTLRANQELEVGELSVQVRELSHQLQLANSAGSEPAPLVSTLVAQPMGGVVAEGKPVAKRTRRKRTTIKPSTSASSDSSSAAQSGSDGEVTATTTTTTAAPVGSSHDVNEPSHTDSPPLPTSEEHIYDEPHSDIRVEDLTHTHLPNIETSSQLLEPDQSLTAREEIDVTYAKLSKAQRKRRPPATQTGTTSLIPVKTVELEEVFPMDDILSPSKRSKHPHPLTASSKQAQPKMEEIAEDENTSTPKPLSLLRRKFGKVMTKSTGRKGKKLTDSTNLGEGEVRFASPLPASPSPKLSRTAGSKRRITKSQISGPLDLISSPDGDVRGNRPKAAISWDLCRRERINYA